MNAPHASPLRRSGESRGGGVIAWDHGWQFPAVTEAHAWRRLQHAVPAAGVFYIGFPWATLIDKLLVNAPDAAEHEADFARFCADLPPARDRVTVCQQIHLRRFPGLFARAGITRLFWSHATPRDLAAGIGAMEVRPFPLYPVQIPADVPAADRRWLFSFVGARSTLFNPRQTRDWILADLSDAAGGFVRGRDRWHYNRIVYDHQIRRTAGPDGLRDAPAEAEFREALGQSVFALCPAGTGPNSIRLWEALGAGAIPVILADDWAPPGADQPLGAALWRQAAVFLPETRAAVRDIPARLAALAGDRRRVSAMRQAGQKLWSRYGPDNFSHDIAALMSAPPPPGPRHPQWAPLPAAAAPPAPAHTPQQSAGRPDRSAQHRGCDWPPLPPDAMPHEMYARRDPPMHAQSPDTPGTQSQDSISGNQGRPMALNSPAAEIQIPLASEAVFWQPRHVMASGALSYLPFLFWLVESLQPRTAVQLGLGDMVAYLGLCQAVDKLGLDAFCMGRGQHTATLATMAAHASHYADFSRLDADDGTAEDATRHLHGQPIDLLILNSPDTDAQEIAADLAESWLPRLSQRGVLLAFEPDAGPDPTALLHSALQRNGRAGRDGIAHITLDHGGDRLHMLLIGPDQPERLRRFAGLAPGEAGFRMSRQVFRRLGQGLQPGEDILTARLAQERQARLQAEEKLAALSALPPPVPGGPEETEAVLAEMLLRLDEADRQETDARIALTNAQTALSETRAELEAARHERDLAREDSDGLRRSTSWRITAPMRRIKLLLSRSPG